MLTTFLIALREYLEVFLIIGVFLGISKKLKLRREKEIFLASLIGIVLSLILPIILFYYSSEARKIFNEKNAELLEGYLSIFSGLFLVYVVFSLHKRFVHQRSKMLIDAHQKLQANLFDLSLFFIIIFFILREGFEIALFTATTSLFADFFANIIGLITGFVVSSFFGLLTFFSYLRFSLGKVFRTTEWLIVFLGAAFFKNGLKEIFEWHFDLHLERVYPISLNFLPSRETFFGHFLNSFFGIERAMSVALFAIIIFYLIFVYRLFLKNK
jgi:FTR1 family protein